MLVIDYKIECSQCGKKLGVATLAYFGVPHSGEPGMTCMECLPSRLDAVEKDNYKPDTIAEIREWMK